MSGTPGACRRVVGAGVERDSAPTETRRHLECDLFFELLEEIRVIRHEITSALERSPGAAFRTSPHVTRPGERPFPHPRDGGV
jgi:hypothetical protein